LPPVSVCSIASLNCIARGNLLRYISVGEVLIESNLSEAAFEDLEIQAKRPSVKDAAVGLPLFRETINIESITIAQES
jgi:hypothetical protein